MSNVLIATAAPPRLARILMPVEFTGRFERAARYAEVLARHYRSEVVLLHVVTTPTLPYRASEGLGYPAIDKLVAGQIAEQTAMLESFLSDELSGIPVRRRVEEGDPARAIVECAAEQQSDLILMPTHGYGALRRILSGSITAGVLRHAPCPVLTGPHLEHAPAPSEIRFGKVLCALDLGPESEAVFGWAVGFAREFGSSLRIVHVVPETTWRAGGIYFDPDWQLHVAREAHDTIAALAQGLQAEVEIGIEIGDVPGAVTAVAREWEPDLLVIGRGARQGLLGRLRAKAYAILRESACPVVAI